MVIKRDNSKVVFDSKKIINAINSQLLPDERGKYNV